MTEDITPADAANSNSVNSLTFSWAASKLLLLESAYEAFCEQKERNPTLTVSQYALQLPEMHASVINFLLAHELFREAAGGRHQLDINWPSPGSMFEDFAIVEQIGQGSFSRVYLAKDLRVGERTVVLKITPNADHEARLLGRLKHPNIVPVFSLYDNLDRTLTAICMPYFGTHTLLDVLDAAGTKDRCNTLWSDLPAFVDAVPPTKGSKVLLRKRDVPPVLASALVAILARIADALAASHASGIVHGDMKPSNVVLGEGGIPYLVDFNLSRDTSAELTPHGGTIPYMAPEQLQSLQSSVLTSQTDVYSFGVTAYELLVGKHPYWSHAETQITHQSLAQAVYETQLKCSAKWPLHLERQYPDVCRLISKCMSIQHSVRPSARHLSTVFSRSNSRSRRWRRLCLKYPAFSSLCAVALLVAFVGGLVAALLREPYDVRELRSAAHSVQLGEYAIADAHLTNVIMSKHYKPFYNLLRGAIRGRLNNLDQAQRDFDIYESVFQDGRGTAASVYWTYQASKGGSKKAVQLSLVRMQQAVEQMRDAVRKGRLKREDSVILHNLGVALQQQGRFPEAFAAFNEAKVVTPHQPERDYLRFRCEFSRIGLQRLPSHPDTSRLVELANVASNLSLQHASINSELATFYLAMSRVDPAYVELAAHHVSVAYRNGCSLEALEPILTINPVVWDHPDVNWIGHEYTAQALPTKLEVVLDPVPLIWEGAPAGEHKSVRVAER